jgi:hypothetical protein
VSAWGQHLVKQDIFNAIATEYSGEAAQENVRDIIQYHRIQGSPMMESVAKDFVLPRLKAAGLDASIEQFNSDGKTKYGTYTSPMGWEIRSGELWVESAGGARNFTPVRLCRYSDVPMCVSTYSKGGDWKGELVEVGSGTKDSDYANKDVKGKVVLASGYAARVVRQAVLKHGAVGAVIYPAADDRPGHPDMVRYNGLWTQADELDRTRGSFQISRNQYDTLKQLMQEGPVVVHGKIDSSLGSGKLTLVHAYIRGTQRDREVLITAHLDHPKWSANDNASGDGAMMEAARTLNTLIASGKIPAPTYTIHFMWVPEYYGTLAYVANHPEARRCGPWDDPRKGNVKGPCVIANINMDMVGEDTVKTNSRFYITRTPDSVSSFLNALMADVLQQTRAADLYAPTGTRNYWLPEIINYAQGSDHDVFLGLGIPATMLGHDPDWTHHTSEDTIDKTDASELRRVGTLASAAAWWIGDGGEEKSARVLDSWFQMEGDSTVQKLNFYRDLGGFTHTSAAANKRKPARGGPGPHRLTLLPLDSSVFSSLEGEDKKWVQTQQERFADDSEGLATKPTFDLLAFETVNLMDGHRSTSEIADTLSAEFLTDIDQDWVDKLVGILAAQKLVATR